MSAESVSIDRVPKGRLALWLLIAGELVIFGGFIASYVLTRFEFAQFGSPEAAGFANMWLGAFNTVVLLVSSYCVVRGHDAAMHKDTGAMTKWLSITIGLAAVFMIVKLGFEWPHDFHEGHTLMSSDHAAFAEPGSDAAIESLFWSYYFIMTGFHGLHVVIGALAIFVVMMGARNGENLHRVELAGLYWHMVDLIWIFLFPMFYLAG